YTYTSNKKVATLFSSSVKDNFNFDDYQLSSDENWILLASEKESIYRRSSKSFYYVYNLKTKELKSLSDTSLGKQMLAEFSPDNSKIAFVRNNNLFYVTLSNFNEKPVTKDGKINKIINGATDWVYEEEFSIHKGFEWSPDGKKLAYYVFDETDVKEFQMKMYGTLYPTHYKFKYPKAGEDNSLISIRIFDTQYDRHFVFDVGNNPDIYIPRIMWSKRRDELIVFKMNRLQNKLELLSGTFSMDTPNNIGIKTNPIYTENSTTYIDIHDNTSFINENEFIWTSEKDGYNHIYLINYANGTEKQLTSGDWDVTEVYGYISQSKKIFFQAAKSHPTKREIYALYTKNNKIELLTEKSGTNEANFSKTFNYFINTHSSADTPFEITLHNQKGKLVKTLEKNEVLKNKLLEFNLTNKEFFTIPNEEGILLNAWMIKPKLLDTLKKHPLLMFVYGGPGINTVNDAWSWNNYFWFQYLAQNGFIVVSVDARGTGYRGKDFKHATYKQLGKYETEDQIAAAKYLANKPYIDENNIGIFGWSYGGYMSSLCITKGADVFKSAIAVAPVTNWRYYDNIYTERFMQKPQDNGENYDINSPINHVEKLKGNYLLIHGTADDNVHFQNATEMVSALVNKNKQFEFFAYPDKNHGIYGGFTRLHLYTKMTNFLMETLMEDNE
ncbi:S9 family peptidase, partial [Bacteroidota bacterium]|nr:S9 family peptidase [Bacteroidota bacterium]